MRTKHYRQFRSVTGKSFDVIQHHIKNKNSNYTNEDLESV